MDNFKTIQAESDSDCSMKMEQLENAMGQKLTPAQAKLFRAGFIAGAVFGADYIQKIVLKTIK